MPRLAAHKFAPTVGLLLVAATALLGLAIDRLTHGSPTLGYALLTAGVVATGVAFSLRIEGDPREATLLLVTREECPLCEEAEILLEHVQDELGFSYWTVDVASDPELLQRYSTEVPVLLHEGEVVASLQVSEQAIRDTLSPA